MRTYYFCTDTAKDMESWMKVMTDAALVHTEPVQRYVLPSPAGLSPRALGCTLAECIENVLETSVMRSLPQGR